MPALAYLALLQRGGVREVDALADAVADVDVDAVSCRTGDVRQAQPVVRARHVHVAHRVDTPYLTVRRRVARLPPLIANSHRPTDVTQLCRRVVSYRAV